MSRRQLAERPVSLRCAIPHRADAHVSSLCALCSLILTYLIVASIPLGFFPSHDLLQHFNLLEPYGGLLTSLKVLPQFPYNECCLVRRLTCRERPAARRFPRRSSRARSISGMASQVRQLLIVAREARDRLLAEPCSKNVRPCWPADSAGPSADISSFRRLFVLTSGSPAPPTGPPTLSLHALLRAAQVSFQDPTLDIDDVESMCVSLMEQVSPFPAALPLESHGD